jgi:putative transposase
MLQWVENALIHNGVFVRNRKSNRVRALGITMYHMGLSLRDTSVILGYFGGASHEAIRNWYSRCKSIFVVKPRKRRAIAIDETKIKIQGKWVFIWAAIDIDSWEVIATWVTQGRSGFEAIQFIRRVLSHCKNKPLVYVDRAGWYKWALNRLGVPWEHKTFGPRNPIEQWFGILKHRIKRFYKRWPYNASIAHVNDWMKSFTCCYHIKKTGGALC